FPAVLPRVCGLLVTSSEGVLVGQGHSIEWFRVGEFHTYDTLFPDAPAEHSQGLRQGADPERDINVSDSFPSRRVRVPVEEDVRGLFHRHDIHVIEEARSARLAEITGSQTHRLLFVRQGRRAIGVDGESPFYNDEPHFGAVDVASERALSGVTGV